MRAGCGSERLPDSIRPFGIESQKPLTNGGGLKDDFGDKVERQKPLTNGGGQNFGEKAKRQKPLTKQLGKSRSGRMSCMANHVLVGDQLGKSGSGRLSCLANLALVQRRELLGKTRTGTTE